MLQWLKKLFSVAQNVITEETEEPLPRGAFSTELPLKVTRQKLLERAEAMTFQKALPTTSYARAGMAMDDQGVQGVKAQLSLANGVSSPVQISWYANQGYIGPQVCALIAQHWLVSKACSMPGEDAIRQGYELIVQDEVNQVAVAERMKELDVQFRLNWNLVQFIKMGRIFGIRIAVFQVDTPNPQEYYENPFNPDGILPGSYKGISQIDPYWCSPELDSDATGNPSSPFFYEPTWWRVGSIRYHRTHLIIMRTDEVPDILKPTYVYGGIPIPQKIYERVYAAERTCNEAPELALTKRTTIYKTDLAMAAANEKDFEQILMQRSYYRNNYATSAIDREDDALQFDTSLTDLDAVIMTQYQIVAAASDVPATKLMGTQPKGFNTTGEYEERSYHEKLESLQAHYLTEFLDRHHLLVMRSIIAPELGIEPGNIGVKWNPIATMTPEQEATVNKTKAETDGSLLNSGAIDAEDIRSRLVNDRNSGYAGLSAEVPESDPEEESLSGEPETFEVEREDKEYE